MMRLAKSKVSAFVAFIAAFALALSMISVSAFAPKAALAATDSGEIVIDNVREGEELMAIKIIDSRIDGNQVLREFKPGFSMQDKRSDGGMTVYESYLKTDTADANAMKRAVDGFYIQYRDLVASDADLEIYNAVADENGNVVFSNLPMGHYLIIDDIDKSGVRAYQSMRAHVEPKVWTSDATTIANPGADIETMFVTAKPVVPGANKNSLQVAKAADAQTITYGSTVRYTVSVTVTDSNAYVENIHIADDLLSDALESGMVLNNDIVITDADGNEIEGLQPIYTYNAQRQVTGYTIDIPGIYEPGTVFNVTYTGNADNVRVEGNVSNEVHAWVQDDDGDNAMISGVASIEIVAPENFTVDDDSVPQDGYETFIVEDDLTPLEQFMNLLKTGDIWPIAFGVLGGIAIIVLIIVLVRRKKKQ